MLQFKAIIESAGRGGAYVAVPFDVEKEFGKKRVPIVALIDGHSYRGLLVRMKTPFHLLIVRKDIRLAIGKEIGDEVLVQMEEDSGERIVIIPADLRDALREYPDLETFFDNLSYTHQKEYVHWIESAKKEETRVGRLRKALEMMREGKKGR